MACSLWYPFHSQNGCVLFWRPKELVIYFWEPPWFAFETTPKTVPSKNDTPKCTRIRLAFCLKEASTHGLKVVLSSGPVLFALLGPVRSVPRWYVAHPKQCKPLTIFVGIPYWPHAYKHLYLPQLSSTLLEERSPVQPLARDTPQVHEISRAGCLPKRFTCSAVKWGILEERSL